MLHTHPLPLYYAATHTECVEGHARTLRARVHTVYVLLYTLYYAATHTECVEGHARTLRVL